MKSHRLLLMRHAKSDWGHADLADHDRPLNARGKAAAPKMAQWLLSVNLVPDVILASTATRVRETVSGMMSVWTQQPPVYESGELYLASPETILRTVRSDAGDCSCVMVVAHNPGLQYLASTLAARQLHFPTAAVACFDFELEAWDQISPASASQLFQYAFPKDLED